MDLEILRRALTQHAALIDIDLVYLFGSRVKGNVGPMSDYDIGLLIRRDADRRQVAARFAHDLVQLIGSDAIDVVILNTATIELAYAVIAQGQVLYERNVAIRVEYEAYVLGLYGDYLPHLRAQQRDILQGDDYERRAQRYSEAFGRTRRTLSEITAAAESTQA